MEIVRRMTLAVVKVSGQDGLKNAVLLRLILLIGNRDYALSKTPIEVVHPAGLEPATF